ncbi:MAG: class II aldolase [Rhodobacteraceae bacterium]|nr:MAG: class II aldolase [Paracoccaceae bacterium]
MTPFAALRADPEFAALRAVSARLGRDPLQVQAAGGNTSLKRDGAMWVKASGAWLAEAEARDVFVPVAQARLAAAVMAGEDAEARDFTPEGVDAPPLRPSIETVVHAVMPQPVVLHTHCVATIAAAIRADAAAAVRDRLAEFDPIFVPWVMPGLPLARALAAKAAPARRVAVLGNHGLVVAGETVAEAAALLEEVSAQLTPTLETALVDPVSLTALETETYRPADAPALHRIARDPARLAMAAAGPFYPDHVVFLGPTLCVARDGEGVEAAAARCGGPPLVILPGLGAALRRDAGPAAEAMARCLGDVIARVAPGAPLSPLPAGSVAALTDWEAEKHRQALSAGRA